MIRVSKEGIYLRTLADIKEYAQNIADTIYSVIGVDVTIVDKNYIRVAATGFYRQFVGQAIGRRSVFIRCMEEKKSFVVKSPRQEKICLECQGKENCFEFSEVCNPIIVDGTVIGVIALIALSEEQKHALSSNEENLLKFLDRMGDMLSSKIIEMDSYEKERIANRQIESIIDSIDDGIIYVDEKNNIIYFNLRIKQMLESNHEIQVSELVEALKIDKEISSCKKTINLQRRYKGSSYVIDIKPVELDGRIIGNIIIIRTMGYINKIINDISVNNIATCFDDIVSCSESMDKLKKKARIAAEGESTILILGESGTGKELLARAIHNTSPRSRKPFIAINCAAIPENLLESELFGYEDGAFTGAHKGGRIGKFELANGGTIFLDEIGDMSLHLQCKLLRVLQERTIERIGACSPVPVDIRIISATHKDLSSMVERGEFRRDLFYRLNVIPLTIPPLRERDGDIKVLADFLLHRFSKKFGKHVEGFDERVYKLFESYEWPGNVRELENVIEYAVNMEPGDKITLESMPYKLKGHIQSEKEVYCLKELERKTIEKAMARFSNRDDAARALGIGRATLFRKIKEYKI